MRPMLPTCSCVCSAGLMQSAPIMLELTGISVREVIEWIATPVQFRTHSARFGARPKRADEPLSLVATWLRSACSIGAPQHRSRAGWSSWSRKLRPLRGR